MNEIQDNTPLQTTGNVIIETFCLIIEDDPDAAFIYKKAMIDSNYRVEHISQGDDAQTALETLCPDVILLDMHLPMVSGDILLQKIRSLEHLSETQVILVTADHGMAEAIQSDADLVLLKPINYGQLRGLVKRILKHTKD